MTSQRSPFRIASYTAITLLILAVIGFTAAELILRVKDRREKAREFAYWKVQQPDTQFDRYRLIYSDERRTPYKVGHQPHVKVVLEHGHFNFTMITNGEGLREIRDYGQLEKSAIFVGDSVVEGSSVENDETMDSVFERMTGLPTLNFGVAARGVYLGYEYLKGKYKPQYSTKLVVFGLCLNDLEESTYIRYFDADTGNWFKLRNMDDGFDLGRGLLFRLSTMPAVGPLFRAGHDLYRESEVGQYLTRPPDGGPRPPVKDMWGSEAVTEVEKRYTAYHFRLMRSFTESIGAHLIVAILPGRRQMTVSYRPGERQQDVTIELLEGLRIPYVDLYPVLKDAVSHDPETRWFWDELHFYKAGHRLVGEHLAAVLVKTFPDLF